MFLHLQKFVINFCRYFNVFHKKIIHYFYVFLDLLATLHFLYAE